MCKVLGLIPCIAINRTVIRVPLPGKGMVGCEKEFDRQHELIRELKMHRTGGGRSKRNFLHR
jgi:hypothetical protein